MARRVLIGLIAILVPAGRRALPVPPAQGPAEFTINPARTQRPPQR